MRICYFIFFERKGHNLNTKYLKNDKNEERFIISMLQITDFHLLMDV